jgi:two-component system, cell cycle response regulator
MSQTDYKVLLGDDDPTMLRLISKWLQRAGFPTRTAADGQEALESIEQECPDFIITDWDMPRINGVELCRRVRKMVLPHYVYIIFLTAKKDLSEMVAGLEVGADDFVGKPVSEAELLARVRSGSRVLELERRLNRMAHTDGLTGLMTHNRFYKNLEKEWRRSQRSHSPLSCVIMDLDFFKQVNDVHGHPLGDSVLKLLAELLLDTCRTSDTVCRYGGEEFGILLPETNELDAALWAERARQRLAALRVPVESGVLHLTGSFGVAQCPLEIDNSERLVDMADQALLCAKRMGRDRVVRYSTLVEKSEPNVNNLDMYDGIFRGVVAGDVMTPLVVSLNEEQPIEDAARQFLDAGISSAPVLNDFQAMVGFVSEKDLMAAMASPACWRRPISEVMRPNVISYETDTPIRVIHEFLCRVSIRSVVITQNGRPVGAINRNAMLQWFCGRGIGASFEDSTTGMAFAPCLHSPDIAPAIPSAV